MVKVRVGELGGVKPRAIGTSKGVEREASRRLVGPDAETRARPQAAEFEGTVGIEVTSYLCS